MEFLLSPNDCGSPPVPAERTPYVCRGRYDGSPFLSYQMKPGQITPSGDLMDLQRFLKVNPDQLAELESSIQTWLYFGFILELLGANSTKKGASLSESAEVLSRDVISDSKDDLDATNPDPLTPPVRSSTKDIIDWLYDTIVVQDGEQEFVVLDEVGLDSILARLMSGSPGTKEACIKYYHHLYDCISQAHSILAMLPRGFHHAVKYSIGAFYEIVVQTLRGALQRAGSSFIYGRAWGKNYLNQEVREHMLAHGWCPSDIARAEVKFFSLEALHLARMMDKSLPRQDHSHCTDLACTRFQVNLDDYSVSHLQDGCRCEELRVQSNDLDDILAKDDRLPLLRLMGDVNNLSVELVESTDDIPYIAISHVWADGLGNPHANSLYRCRLIQLLEWVTAVSMTTMPNTVQPPLIWLDTLCCPAKEGGGKQKALEKIRLVYQRASIVLVLDTGLMPYKAKAQNSAELAIRIFTSSWFRRLWTLQEGALANSLYFQFADETVSLNKLRDSFMKLWPSVRHQILILDVLREFWRLETFFHGDRHVPADQSALVILDEALQHRSVSVATDEALCIGTLMSLDLAAILQVERKENRMQKVWELLAIKRGGIPAQVIFFEEPKLDARGWRWAPRSLLLTTHKRIIEPNIRMIRWGDPQLGKPTRRGLRVQYPGWYINVRKYVDSKPRHPWPKLKRIPEAYANFREPTTGIWYIISDNKYTALSRDWTDEDREAYNELNLFPLHDIADTDKSVIITLDDDTVIKPGVFALPTVNEPLQGDEEGLAVEAKASIHVSPLTPDKGYIYDVTGRLAMQLRADAMTDAHLALYACLTEELAGDGDDDAATTLDARLMNNDEFKVSIRDLRQRMREMMADVLARDARLTKAVETHFGGPDYLDSVWILIQDWFNHDYVGTRAEETVWFVD